MGFLLIVSRVDFIGFVLFLEAVGGCEGVLLYGSRKLFGCSVLRAFSASNACFARDEPSSKLVVGFGVNPKLPKLRAWRCTQPRAAKATAGAAVVGYRMIHAAGWRTFESDRIGRCSKSDGSGRIGSGGFHVSRDGTGHPDSIRPVNSRWLFSAFVPFRRGYSISAQNDLRTEVALGKIVVLTLWQHPRESH